MHFNYRLRHTVALESNLKSPVVISGMTNQHHYLLQMMESSNENLSFKSDAKLQTVGFKMGAVSPAL